MAFSNSPELVQVIRNSTGGLKVVDFVIDSDIENHYTNPYDSITLKILTSFIYSIEVVEGHLNPGLFNPKLQPQSFNPRLFNHERFNPGLFNHEFLNHGVEKSGVEMSFNHLGIFSAVISLFS